MGEPRDRGSSDSSAWSLRSVNDKLALAMSTCHLPLQGLNQVLLQILSFNPPERSSAWRAEMGHSLLWENLAERSSDRYFQEQIFWAQFLHLLISRKALISFMVTAVSHDTKHHDTIRNLQKLCAWLHVVPVNKITYILTFPQSSFLRLSEMLSPGL